MPVISRRVKFGVSSGALMLVASFGTFALHSIDASTMAAQVPAKCAKTQWVVNVPRTHINAPLIQANDVGPALSALMVKHPEFSLNSVIAANPELTLNPYSSITAVAGGIRCLNLPTKDVVQNSAETLVLPGPDKVPTKTKAKLNLNFKSVYLSDAQIVSVHYAAGFRGEQLIIMSAIAMAESGGKTTAVCRNSGHGCNASPRTQLSADYGLDQINSSHHVTASTMFNPIVCARIAKKLVDRRHSFRDWVTYNHGHDKKFRTRMRRAAKKLNLI